MSNRSFRVKSGVLGLAPQSTPPSNANTGDLYVDTTNALNIWNGSSWQEVGGSLLVANKDNTDNGTVLTSGTKNFIDTSTAAFGMTLPSGAANSTLLILDTAGFFTTNNFTVAPAAGEQIADLAVDEPLVFDVAGAWAEFSWDSVNSRWALVSPLLTAVGGAPNYQFTGLASQLELALPITHNLGDLPQSIEMWVEQNPGEWEQHDPATYMLATATQLVSTGTDITDSLGSDPNVRVIAARATPALALDVASETQQGVVSTTAQTFGGVKTFAVDPAFTSGSTLVTTGSQTFTGLKTFSTETIFNDKITLGGDNKVSLSADPGAAEYTLLLPASPPTSTGDVLTYTGTPYELSWAPAAGGGQADFPDVDFVISSNFDLVTQTSAVDEKGRDVTAPSTILLTGQTDATENGVYDLTAFKIPDQFTISGTTSNIEGKTYVLATVTGGRLERFPFGGSAVENTAFGSSPFDFSFSPFGSYDVYVSTDNLSVIWFDTNENAWFGGLYFSAIDINDGNTYEQFNLTQISGFNFGLWITNAGVTDISLSSITTVVPQPDVVIARNAAADADSDFTESRKVMSDFSVYKYTGSSTPSLGTDALPFALFSTKYDEQSVSGAVGDLSGGLYRVENAVATTFGNLENLTLYVKDTDVTFNGSITNCKILVDNSESTESFIFDGLIDRSEIVVRGSTGNQGELRQNMERSKLTVTSTSNSNSPLRIVNNPGSSWQATQSQLYFHCYFDTSVTGTFVFSNCYIFCASTMRVQSATTNFVIDVGSTFDIYYLNLQGVSDPSPTIDGMGKISLLDWRNGVLQLGGTTTIGTLIRRNGASSSSELRSTSLACLNIGSFVIYDSDAVSINAVSETSIDIGWIDATAASLSNIDGSYLNGVIRIGFIEGATFDTNAPANARNITAVNNRQIWFDQSGVLGTAVG